MNDIIPNTVQSIRRAREEFRLAGENFATDYTRQDAAILNVTRACEQAIDLANHIIKIRQMGIPTSSPESFELLARQRVLDQRLAQNLKSKVGFRNIAVRQDQSLNPAILQSVLEFGLDDLLVFTQSILDYSKHEKLL